MTALLHDSPHRQQPAAAYVPLLPGARVAMRRTLCLRSRLHASACRACTEACPVGALRIDAARVELHEGCTGCGRCQAACPVGALRTPEFDGLLEQSPTTGDAPLYLECARQPAPVHAARVQVPCLGGVSPAALLALCAQAPGRPVLLADAGACASCDSGGARHPLTAVPEQVRRWLGTAGVPERLLPRIERVDAARTNRGAASRDPMQSDGRARRGFLGALVRPMAARPLPAAREPASGASAPRKTMLAALAKLAAHHGGRVDPQLFHSVEISAECEGRRVCAASCPTGALLRYRDDATGVSGVAFNPTDCIGCTHCAVVCPRQALRVLPAKGAALDRHLLTRFAQRACAACGARFLVQPQNPQAHCQRCHTNAHLARSAFASLYPSRTRLQALEPSHEELR